MNPDLRNNPEIFNNMNLEPQSNSTSITTPIVVNDYSVDETKHKKSLVDKLKFKN